MRISDWSSDVCSSDLGQGQTAIGRMTDAGAIVETRRLDTDAALNLNGTSAPAHLDRQRAEVYVSHTFDAGGTLRGALLGDSEGTPGAAVPYAWRDARQETRLGATSHRASWELVSGIVNDGTQDSVDLQHERQFGRSEEHTSELQSLMRISYAVFCLKK